MARGATISLDDAELVLRVRDGDTAAFDSLYRAHVRAVHTVARDGVRDPDLAAEVVQEVFTRALEKLARLDDPSRFRPWVLSIARHAVVDVHRAGKRVTELDDETADTLPDSDPGPDTLAELDELARLVNGAVAGLSPRDATAVSLVTHLGFSPAEVADALGVTPGAAKVIVHRARRRLRDTLSLELMVRGRRGCADFTARYDTGDLVAATRHLRGCPQCADIVAAEVQLYDATEPPR